MSMITSVRSPVSTQPLAQTTRQDQPARAPVATTTRPVSETLRTDATAQTAATAASVASRLAERDESRHPATDARIAADAAREAYIKASIAAGLSPLPLP